MQPGLVATAAGIGVVPDCSPQRTGLQLSVGHFAAGRIVCLMHLVVEHIGS